MKTNLQVGASYQLKNGAPLHDLRFAGQGMAALSSNGEINASSNADLLKQIGQLLQSVSSGTVVQAATPDSFLSLSADQKRDILVAAKACPTKWAALGAHIAADVREQASRQGFSRNLCVINNLKQGETQKVPMPRHQAKAVLATGPTSISYQMMRDKYFTPPEFELKAAVRVNKLDLGQATHDLLDHAYNDAVEGMITAADRVWKRAADATVGKANTLAAFAGAFTPAVIARASTQIRDWNLPVSRAVIANSFWEDIQSEGAWANTLTPVSQYELVMTGRVATIFGLELTTDGFRPENQRVLSRGEAYIVADNEYHATLGSRGGIESTPTDGANQGDTTKGWLLSEVMSLIIPNTRSVVKMQKL